MLSNSLSLSLSPSLYQLVELGQRRSFSLLPPLPLDTLKRCTVI